MMIMQIAPCPPPDALGTLVPAVIRQGDHERVFVLEKLCSISQARVDVKVCLLGSSGVGKTCLLDCYVNDQFEPSQRTPPTIGAAFAAKKERHA